MVGKDMAKREAWLVEVSVGTASMENSMEAPKN